MPALRCYAEELFIDAAMPLAPSFAAA